MLSYDTARCKGYDNPVCRGCLRLEPGHPTWQSYAKFPNPVGYCADRKDSSDALRPVSKDKGRHIGSSTADLHGETK